jgi:acyl-homoserine lactone acylase PvdQ
LAAAVAYLEERFESDNPDDWLWGRIHLVKFNSFFGSFGVPNDFDLGPYANVGGLYTINVAGWGRPFDQNHGASTRILGEMTPENSESVQVIPGGNIDDLGHVNRSDQVPMWLDGQYRRMPRTREEVRDAALARTELIPGSNARWRFEP